MKSFESRPSKTGPDTTIQVWMGLTMGCAKCHTHKYDPISQQEYYQVYAVFNQTEDADRYDDAPVMQVISPEQNTQLQAMREEIQSAEETVGEAEVSIAARIAELRPRLDSARRDIHQFNGRGGVRSSKGRGHSSRRRFDG